MVFEFETYQDFQNWQLSNGGTIEKPLTLGPNVGYIKETKQYIIQIYSDGIPKNQLVDFSYFTGKSINDKYVAEVLKYELQHNYKQPTNEEKDPIYNEEKEGIFNDIDAIMLDNFMLSANITSIQDNLVELSDKLLCNLAELSDKHDTLYLNLGDFSFWKGTQAQYDALTSKDNNKIYLITEN